jgi:hypothetical protein
VRFLDLVRAWRQAEARAFSALDALRLAAGEGGDERMGPHVADSGRASLERAAANRVEAADALSLRLLQVAAALARQSDEPGAAAGPLKGYLDRAAQVLAATGGIEEGLERQIKDEVEHLLARASPRGVTSRASVVTAPRR